MPISPTQADARFMQQALRLACRGLGHVEPNPLVGCVLVRGGRTIGQGYHRVYGGPHAEVEALEDCRRRGLNPAGATAYVTLEPCCHHGKTPPCTEALIAARLAAVFVATHDPSPHAAGQGIHQLESAGLTAHVGLLENRARRLNLGFFKRIEQGLPLVTAKWAQTLDGRIASTSGDSKWISSPRSRRSVHRLRARVDAILTGIGTVLADDPQLTARDVPRRRMARRVVVDANLRLPLESELVLSLQRDPEAPPLTLGVNRAVMRSRPPKLAALQSMEVELVALDPESSSSGRLDLRPLLRHLVQAHDATHVLIESGSRLLGSLFAQGLVDEVRAFIAPKLLGQSRARAAVEGLSGSVIHDAVRLELRRSRRLGSDVVLDYRVSPDDRVPRSG